MVSNNTTIRCCYFCYCCYCCTVLLIIILIFVDIDTAGEGALKVEWNEHMLKNTLPELYGELLTSLSELLTTVQPNQLPQQQLHDINDKFYRLWPDISQCATPFDKLAIGLAHNIVSKKREVLMSTWSGKWIGLGMLYFLFLCCFCFVAFLLFIL